ncbi:uncharacterized protein LOC117643732 [Thrips palmi]|uniref:Uncharacterized protein LOC117643732 n=1 Tax=Thrips palmi TaxID=161013 RepID=A0A6P8YP82_THRPL|nr:uncharacterized protein LOC117643732 [Thrips palmi]
MHLMTMLRLFFIPTRIYQTSSWMTLLSRLSNRYRAFNPHTFLVEKLFTICFYYFHYFSLLVFTILSHSDSIWLEPKRPHACKSDKPMCHAWRCQKRSDPHEEFDACFLLT